MWKPSWNICKGEWEERKQGWQGCNSEALLWKEAETVAVSKEMICVLLVNLRKATCWFEAGNDVMKNSWFLKEMRIAEIISLSSQEGMEFSLQWRIDFNRSTVHLVTARKIGRGSMWTWELEIASVFSVNQEARLLAENEVVGEVQDL